MIVNQIQQQIEDFYRIRSGIHIEDFMLTIEALKKIYPSLDNKEPVPKELTLISFENNTHYIGLFVDPLVLRCLEEKNPMRQLDKSNFENFLTVVEGVSHFVYLYQRALIRRPATELELEIQAEVDKYLLCLLYLNQKNRPLKTWGLLKKLFHSYHLKPQLTPEQMQRYQLAHRLGYRFCRHLAGQCRHWHHLSQRMKKIRDFFHSGLTGKLHALA
ncbi:MAG: hypothetical protein A3I75_00780 [Deltaproteobacteria bacterium RIFCSPLOWO2_02_FULL_50_16]|nr:MAG: hypothetical protein A2053_04620 [Deltaproteobacteria bacterium GWA2_50_8]OGQ30516.1 MAG: hypothetical protein A3B79_02550 [Deltaproteobacteria bacterium RIFCSPHIGHO2_02_FULL_50_15]OGQ56362.1 MAG: hypothetical protein A3I75_00780 [Deltaproteobacteria bacterium RIFCSPLOWO2_02_FULL_50_16]OGQ67765.1 MAG: hypothetical protein A3F89_02025 [Deltaproteobacteria bacterium RIFCSPLOWO2_12_FULL_50_11]